MDWVEKKMCVVNVNRHCRIILDGGFSPLWFHSLFESLFCHPHEVLSGLIFLIFVNQLVNNRVSLLV